MTELFIKQEQKYNQYIKNELDNTQSIIDNANNIINELLDNKQIPTEDKIIEKPIANYIKPIQIKQTSVILEYFKKIKKCSKIINNNLLIIKNNNNKNIINNKIIEIKKCINIIINYIHKLKKNINNM
jgi:hypothetical protein